MCPAPLPLLTEHRTRDLSPVMLTILIEHYYTFKNIDTPTPYLVKIMTFNSLKLIFNSIFLGNQSAYNCAGCIKSSFRLKTQFRRVTSVGPSTVRNVKVNI